MYCFRELAKGRTCDACWPNKGREKKLCQVLRHWGGNLLRSDRRWTAPPPPPPPPLPAATGARTGKMARRYGCATSRFSIYTREIATFAVWLCFCLLFASTAEAGLYTSSDQIIMLTPQSVESVLVNSSAAIVVEFYASWCGHCIAFSPIYKSLARDMKGWYEACGNSHSCSLLQWQKNL